MGIMKKIYQQPSLTMVTFASSTLLAGSNFGTSEGNPSEGRAKAFDFDDADETE